MEATGGTTTGTTASEEATIGREEEAEVSLEARTGITRMEKASWTGGLTEGAAATVATIGDEEAITKAIGNSIEQISSKTRGLIKAWMRRIRRWTPTPRRLVSSIER